MNTLEIAIRAALRTWDISREMLFASRENWPVEARFTVMHILRNRGMSLSEIGRLFDRDHAAVSNAVKQAQAWIHTHDGFRNRHATAVGIFNAEQKKSTATAPASDPLPPPEAYTVRLDYTDERGGRYVLYGTPTSIRDYLNTHLIPTSK